MLHGSIRIAMWSGPRNISTALMRAWENRPDAWVVDEPLYAHYLTRVSVAHPGTGEVIEHHDSDWQRVVTGLIGPIPEGRRVYYQKHMAHHWLPHLRGEWIFALTNAFLIRHPAEMLPSLAAKMGRPVLRDTGLPQQVEIHHNNLLQSILAKIEANVAGADDALMLDTRGFIAETNATHLFFVERGVVRTPTTAACPEGITRAAVLELCAAHGIPHQVTDLSLTEAYRADEAFCTGTMGELAAVTTIDGRTIGEGRAGAMTRRLTALFRELTAREGEPVA